MVLTIFAQITRFVKITLGKIISGEGEIQINILQPKILVYSPKQAEDYERYIRENGFLSVTTAVSPEEAEQYLPDTEVILGWKFPTHLLNKPIASSVRWYQSTGAGVDDLVNDKTIPERITLTRIVDQFGSYISEYVFSYLLYLLKNFPRMILAQMEHRWDPFISESLKGKTIGVAGLGSIGTEIVRKGRAFDMTVHGLSASRNHADIVDFHFTPDEWHPFVKDLDYLVLTLPLTDETHHVIDMTVLSSMKPGACLVNVGRGALIVEKDLLSVLRSGSLRAAILDVFEKEPLPENHEFYHLPNVYVTSHLSGPSTAEGVSHFFVDNLKRYINGKPLHGRVDREKGY